MKVVWFYICESSKYTEYFLNIWTDTHSNDSSRDIHSDSQTLIMSKTSTKYFRASAGVSRLTQVFWQTDRRTTEEHANIGILRSSSWKFEVNPSSNLGGDVRSSFLTDRHTDRRTTEYHANIGILRSSSWKFEVNPSSSLVGFVQSSFWPRPTGHVLLIVYGQN